jgi:ACS family tartrate transporter-like MFS transporter
MVRALMEMRQGDLGGSVRSRIAWRLLPFLFLLYVANYLDRTNIAYATLGMKGHLHLSDSVFGTASGIFFIGYVALQIPSALLVEHWSAKRLLALTLVMWGGLTVLTGFVRTPPQLYCARFLLGAAEAGFFPGVIVYLARWFSDRDRARAGALFMAAIPIAYILGGPLAGAILGVDWLGLAGWRWLFLLEGIPAVFLGVGALFVLPDQPEEADWLSPNERDWIRARLAEERSATTGDRMSAWQAFRHPAVLILTAGLFLTYTGGYAFWFWEPTILQRLTGWSILRVSWFGVLIFGFSLLALLSLGWNSDRTGERRWHFAIPQLLAALALLAWVILPHSHILLVILFALIAAGTVAYLPIFWTLPATYLTSSAAAAAIGFINCTASIGGFLGPKIFGELSQRTLGFESGFFFMIACWIIASVIVLLCPRDRAKRAS